MNKFTMTRIETADQERLKAWAKLTRRSATQQLGAFIPPLPPADEIEQRKALMGELDPKPTPLEVTTKALKENKLPETFKATIKPQAKFGATKPIPKGKSK